MRELQPGLLVIDCGLLEDEVCALVRQVHQEWPHVRCLVLTWSRRQRDQAAAAGAAVVLARDCPVQELGAALQQI